MFKVTNKQVKTLAMQMLIISKQQDRRDGLASKRSCQSYRQVGSIGSTYMGLTTTHYYKFRGCKAIFWLLWVQGTHVVHIHVYRQKTHIDSKEFKANTISRNNFTNQHLNDLEDSGSINIMNIVILRKRMIHSARFQNSKCKWSSGKQHILDMYKTTF